MNEKILIILIFGRSNHQNITSRNMFIKLSYIRKYSGCSWCTSRFTIDLVKKYLQKLNIKNARKISTNTNQELSEAYLQVLGSGAQGGPGNFYLQTGDKRYYFNCGEGFGRLFLGNRPIVKQTITDIFFTSRTWRNIGGLPGLALTLDISKYSKIILHGPEALEELFKPLWFIYLKHIKIEMEKLITGEGFEDDNVIIKYVYLRSHSKMGETRIRNVPNAAVLDKYATTKEKHIKDSNNKMEAIQTKSDCHIAYICKIKKKDAELDLYESVDSGVKPEPGLNQISNGDDVVPSDGTLTVAKHVPIPDNPEVVIIVLEVPDVSYLRESEFAAHFDDGINSPENIPAVVVHFTPPHVFNNVEYRKFMSLFGAATKHLVLNSQNTCLGMESVHTLQHKLHLLDSHIFPLLSDDSITTSRNVNNEDYSEDVGDVIKKDNQLQLIEGRTLTTYHLRPNRELDRSKEPNISIQDCIQEAMKVKGFINCLEEFRQRVAKTRIDNNNTSHHDDYPKIVFLGTNSSCANRTRNSSAIVVQINQDNSILLDCGEGTLTQLVRFFGRERANAFLRTLKAVYISHMHNDHHIGLIGILQSRRAAFQDLSLEVPQLQLLAPWVMSHWLTTYDRRFEKILDDFILVPNEKLLMSVPNSKLNSSVLRSVGVEYAVTCDVIHCPSSFGLALQIGQHKITYSGDTCPCDDLIKIGQNSTLLIHEATLEDELVKNARFHTTTSQAIMVGHRMGAKHTILTHFSPRYRVVPRLGDQVLINSLNVGIAFDYMQLSMNDLEILPHMYAPLRLMFAKECEYAERKAVNRTRKMLWK